MQTKRSLSRRIVRDRRDALHICITPTVLPLPAPSLGQLKRRRRDIRPVLAQKRDWIQPPLRRQSISDYRELGWLNCLQDNWRHLCVAISTADFERPSVYRHPQHIRQFFGATQYDRFLAQLANS